jgi:hypothetical protein
MEKQFQSLCICLKESSFTVFAITEGPPGRGGRPLLVPRSSSVEVRDGREGRCAVGLGAWAEGSLGDGGAGDSRSAAASRRNEEAFVDRGSNARLGWGIFAKQHRRQRGLAGGFSQNIPTLLVAIRSRSGDSDQSFRSFHRWAGFHLIRSQLCDTLHVVAGVLYEPKNMQR